MERAITNLEDIEQQRRVDAQTRHDLMTALTRATSINQMLEIILVNLRPPTQT